MHKLETLRTLTVGRFTVEIAAYVEDTHPLDTVDYGDDPEAKAAEREYARKIEQGVYPWFCLGVHVYVNVEREGYVQRRHEVGSAYLGCVDTYNLHDVGLRDVVAEAVEDARATLSALRAAC